MLRLQTPLPDNYTLAPEDELVSRIAAAKAALGEQLLILGHHYQRDEVIRWADAVGDSFKLAKFAADTARRRFIVFCGVHFMAESADVLTGAHQQVILPDLTAGCSMADMADITRSKRPGTRSTPGWPSRTIVPITYMNSSAAIKAFVGAHGGAVCTSSNARAVLEWALGAALTRSSSSPTSTWAATPASRWATARRHPRVEPHNDRGGLEERDVKDSTLLLWKGHCSVHQRFRPEHVAAAPAEYPNVEVIVHPECAHDLVEVADRVGSTERIQEWVAAAPAGAVIAVATEIHMVQRLAGSTPKRRCSRSTR